MVIHNNTENRTQTTYNGLWIRPCAMSIKTVIDTLCHLVTGTFIAATELKQKYCLIFPEWCKAFHSFQTVITRSYLGSYRGELPKWDLHTLWENTPCSAKGGSSCLTLPTSKGPWGPPNACQRWETTSFLCPHYRTVTSASSSRQSTHVLAQTRLLLSSRKRALAV